MKKLTFFLALGMAVLFGAQQAKAATVDLSKLTADYVAQNGDILNGTLANNVKISIAPDAKITLYGVSINADGAFSGSHAGITCQGNAEIRLSNSNTIKSFGEKYPGIQAPYSGTLKIKNDGMTTGWLTVTGGKFAPGIGASYYENCQHIEINGGDVTATGGDFAAGIGGANGKTHGNIVINADVTATGGTGGAGIGSGYDAGQSGHISIIDDKVVATGGQGAAGIGSGESSECLDISILNNCKVTATGGANAPAIGCGVNGKCGDITIGENPTITATKGAGASYTVGGASGGSKGKVTIDGVDRGYGIATSPWNYPEPWDGNLATLKKDTIIQSDMTLYGTLAKDVKINVLSGVKLTLDNVSINADSTLNTSAAAGLECGGVTIILKGKNIVRGHKSYYPGISVESGTTLTIKEGEAGASLEASGMYGAAGIGSRNSTAGGNVVIESGTITAIGGSMGAGIGGAYNAACGDITIKGGTINAFGGTHAAAIGGGWKGNCGNITITKGVNQVTATKLNPAYTTYSVGAGDEATCGTITIGGETQSSITDDVYVFPFDELYAVWDAGNTTLTLRYDKNRVANSGVTDWSVYKADATKVILDESMQAARPKSTNKWFYMFSELEEIQYLDYLNTSEVTDMQYMFFFCKKLASLDVSHFNTEKVTNMEGMFLNLLLTSLDLRSFNIEKVTNMSFMFRACINLETIHCNSDWSSTTANTTDMFSGCLKLKGSNGTPYDEDHEDAAYARPDKDGQPGYFTWDKTKCYGVYDAATTTLTVYYDDQYFSRGGVDFWMDDAAVPHYDVTVIALDESVKDFRPTGAVGMFDTYPNLKEFRHLEYLNTSEVTQMNAMFRYCGMKTLDLTSFNVDKVTSFYRMFYNCNGLEKIYCSEDWSVKTANKTEMFVSCWNLVGGNGTPFDAEKVNGEYARPDKPGQPGYFTKDKPTGIEEVQRDDVPCTKVLRDGQIYLMYKGTMYNVQGQRVK